MQTAENQVTEKPSIPPETPLFSVCMLTYNRAELLRRALQAVMAISFEAFEVVVVDDGSTDHTGEVVQAFKQGEASSKIAYVRHAENQGRPAARNTCIAHARGQFIVWADDDDLVFPPLLSAYDEFLKAFPQTDILYCDLLAMSLDKTSYRKNIAMPDYAGQSNRLRFDLFWGGGIPSPGSCVRRSLYEECGGYDARFPRAQDYQFWMRASAVARFRRVPKQLMVYRIHSGNSLDRMGHDMSYEALAIRECVQSTCLSRLFPAYDWREIETAKDKACLYIAHGLALYKDFFNAARYLEQVNHLVCYPEAFQRRATCLMMSGQWAALAAMFQQAATVSEVVQSVIVPQVRQQATDWADAVHAMRQAFMENRYKQLFQAIRLIRSRFKLNADVYEILGQLHQSRGRNRWAAQCYGKAMALNPSSLENFEKAMAVCATPAMAQEMRALRDRLGVSGQDSPLYQLSALS